MRSHMMQARLMLVVTLALLATLAAIGQEAEYGFGGGGPGVGQLMSDLGAINEFVEGAGFARFSGNPLLVGGGGRGGLVPGPVFGGAGWGAWIESREGERHAEYGVGLGGFDMGYAIGGSNRSVLTVGGLFGAGGAEIIFTEYPPSEASGIGPGGLVIEPERTTYDSFFAFAAPYIDMQIQLLDWVGLGVRACYVQPIFELAGSSSGPLDPPNLAPSGPYVRFSIVFGGFGALEPTPSAEPDLRPTPEPEPKAEPRIQTESIVP